MRALLDRLFNAQKTLLRNPPLSAEHRQLVEELRDTVPTSILAHFLRMVVRGQPGVALVQHGVCSSCHIRVPLGTLASLARKNDLHLCESCAAYLMLAEEAPPAPAPSHPVAKVVKRGRRPAAIMAA